MDVIRDLAYPVWPGERSVITIGAYDGLHLGHRQVMARVTTLAQASNARSVVVTFARHPALVVRPESAPLLLTSPEERLELMATTGIDAAIVLPFGPDEAAEEAEDFVERVFVRALSVATVVVGSDFHFGRGRRGDVEMLRRMGVVHDFVVEPIDLIIAAGGPVISSTAVRSALAKGDLESVEAMLGRRHRVDGIVVTGDHRGRTIGFPTANVAVPAERQIPADGVYAALVTVGGSQPSRPAVVNIGRRPTFDADPGHSLVEVHLIGADLDLYGQHLVVEFVDRLRGERRFESVDALVAQIGADRDQAASLLGVVAKKAQP